MTPIAKYRLALVPMYLFFAAGWVFGHIANWSTWVAHWLDQRYPRPL